MAGVRKILTPAIKDIGLIMPLLQQPPPSLSWSFS